MVLCDGVCSVSLALFSVVVILSELVESLFAPPASFMRVSEGKQRIAYKMRVQQVARFSLFCGVGGVQGKP
jgi:hypothetical protein